ncbi:MAG: carboxypeptidase regulatory-like domain-containing protein, partial [Candidatus Eremiobacteraeota bacterium]|nr:carboxypeptidase regulatory-like domain-containing protein [Candidatus Eremiobacteraeota bacterium]
MNRTLSALAAIATVFLGTPVGAQVALVVGSVRDQRGLPIAGAAVTALPAGIAQPAVTSADGTFAVEGEGVASVTIRCRYCATRTFAVVRGQPVVAIVSRFSALLDPAPSPEDLAALPYGRVESSIALRPFELL